MDIDFIKWMCEKAEGFAFEEDHTLFLPTGDFLWEESVTDGHYEEWKVIYYPLLLQRAIEGVNLTSGIWIQIVLAPDNGGSVAWKPMIKSDNFQGLNGDLFLWIDQAKEQALRYIYEQEKS